MGYDATFADGEFVWNPRRSPITDNAIGRDRIVQSIGESRDLTGKGQVDNAGKFDRSGNGL
jgi:hypothetical protein